MNIDQNISTSSLESGKVEAIIYHNAFVAFIDILGFKETILGNNFARVSLYHSIIKNVVHQRLKPPEHLDLRFNIQVMSDSIVISAAPMKSTGPADYINAFRALSLAVGALQFEFAINDFWARGGITFGPIAFLDTNFVVGPALVKSYELERDLAKVPRVIIDHSVPGLFGLTEADFILKVNHKTHSEAFGPLVLEKNFIPNSNFRDHNFVNFLYFFEHDWDFVIQAAQKISQFLKNRLSEKNEHYEKYMWVSKYISSLKLPNKIISQFEWINTQE